MYNVTIAGFKNPTDNTDIFLTYSDDGGRTWSDPVQVNDDQSAARRLHRGELDRLPNPDEVTGRAQFQPAIAVDPVTGTLVLSWRDGRDDPRDTLVATYITASIDGGNTFNPQAYANPSRDGHRRDHGPDARPGPAGRQQLIGQQPTARPPTASAPRWAWPSTTGSSTRSGRATSTRRIVVNGAIQGSAAVHPCTSRWSSPPGRGSSTAPWGRSRCSEAQSGKVSFTVTFDRPINPPGIAASFTAADVQVFYHDTTNGDPSIPLDVLSVTPVISSGVGPGNKFGYTQFTVTFNPRQGARRRLQRHRELHRHLQLPGHARRRGGQPDRGADPVVCHHRRPPADHRAGRVGNRGPANSRRRARAGRARPTISRPRRSTIAGHANQIITGITVNLSLTHNNDSDLIDHPDGSRRPDRVVYQGTFNGPVTFNNQAFTVNGLDGGRAPV